MKHLITWPWALALGLFYLAAAYVIHLDKVVGSVLLTAGILAFHRPLGRLLGGTLVDSWKILNREARQERAAASLRGESRDFDYRPLVVLAVTAVTLTLIEYFGDRGTYTQFLNRVAPDFFHNRYYELTTFAYWTGFRVLGYVVIPWLSVLFMPGERIRDYGLKLSGALKHTWIYLALFLIVLPAVVMVSYTREFQQTYPFYKLASRSWFDYLGWEALYALQFWALEVFFRGYMLHPLKRSMGSYAIFCMAVPYCMIHYHKPLAEVLGAVAAGVVLGTLSMRTGSIWCGVLIHVSVAVSMDGLSMAQTMGWPGKHFRVPG